MQNKYSPSPDMIGQQLPDLINRYVRLPNYIKVPRLLEKQKEIQAIHDPSASIYYENARSNGWAAARAGDYDQALSIVGNALNELPNQNFPDHDKTAIEILLTRRFGRIYEHQATFGEEEKPLSDIGRRTHFLLAAYHYIQADFELGGITEFAGRASEAFAGAGMPKLQSVLLRTFFGENTIINPPTEEVVELICQLRKVGHEETGGGSISYWGKEK